MPGTGKACQECGSPLRLTPRRDTVGEIRTAASFHEAETVLRCDISLIGCRLQREEPLHVPASTVVPSCSSRDRSSCTGCVSSWEPLHADARYPRHLLRGCRLRGAVPEARTAGRTTLAPGFGHGHAVRRGTLRSASSRCCSM